MIATLPGKPAPHRKLAGGKAQTVHSLMLPGAHVFMRPVAGVDAGVGVDSGSWSHESVGTTTLGAKDLRAERLCFRLAGKSCC